jgi:hypothetical protein
LSDRLAAFNKAAEAPASTPVKPVAPVGKLTDRVAAFAKEAEQPKPIERTAPVVTGGMSMAERMKKLEESAAKPVEPAERPVPVVTGGMSMAERMKKLEESAAEQAAKADKPKAVTIEGGMTMAERMAALAESNAQPEEGDEGEDGTTERPATEGDVDGDGESAPSAPRRVKTTFALGMGGPKQPEPEKDTEIEEVKAAPQMAMRTARRGGGRRPTALADLE